MAILSTIKKVMPYLKTATGYVLCRLSSQAVEMDDGTTLQESYDSLNSKISGAAGQIVWCGLLNLLYNRADNMQGVVNDAPSDIFDNQSNYTVLVTMRNVAGTPYGQVDRLTYDIRTDQRILVIDGYGAGFVSGHVVSVSVLIVKKL